MALPRAASFLALSTVAVVAFACGGRSTLDGPYLGENDGTSAGTGGSSGKAGTAGVGNVGNTAGYSGSGNVGNAAGFGGQSPTCAPGMACQPGAACTTSDGPPCVTYCQCAGGAYQCQTNCGQAGAAGAPSQCLPGYPCSPGMGCSAPDPYQPDCFYDCSCSKSGVLQCGQTCTGPGGAGGSPSACEVCVMQGAGPPACDPMGSKCGQNPACWKWSDCVAASGCLSTSDIASCVDSSCGPPPGAVEKAATDFIECAACACQGPCGVSPQYCGAGGGPPQGCTSCAKKAIESNQCAGELQQCAATPGCSQLGQCALQAGCLEQPDPVTCAKKSCKGSPQAHKAVESIFQCAACSPSCGAACSVACGGGGTGGAGGGPQTSCDQCTQTKGQQQCAKQLVACMQSVDCQAIGKCTDSGASLDDCYKKYPKGVPAYDAVLTCMVCEACPGPCSEYGPFFCYDTGAN